MCGACGGTDTGVIGLVCAGDRGIPCGVEGCISGTDGGIDGVPPWLGEGE